MKKVIERKQGSEEQEVFQFDFRLKISVLSINIKKNRIIQTHAECLTDKDTRQEKSISGEGSMIFLRYSVYVCQECLCKFKLFKYNNICDDLKKNKLRFCFHHIFQLILLISTLGYFLTLFSRSFYFLHSFYENLICSAFFTPFGYYPLLFLSFLFCWLISFFLYCTYLLFLFYRFLFFVSSFFHPPSPFLLRHKMAPFHTHVPISVTKQQAGTAVVFILFLHEPASQFFYQYLIDVSPCQKV